MSLKQISRGFAVSVRAGLLVSTSLSLVVSSSSNVAATTLLGQRASAASLSNPVRTLHARLGIIALGSLHPTGRH